MAHVEVREEAAQGVWSSRPDLQHWAMKRDAAGGCWTWDRDEAQLDPRDEESTRGAAPSSSSRMEAVQDLGTSAREAGAEDEAARLDGDKAVAEGGVWRDAGDGEGT